MKRTCALCGKECNEQLMEPMSSGRKTEWWCWDCYLNSQREAAMSEMYRQKKLYKIKKSKERSK